MEKYQDQLPVDIEKLGKVSLTQSPQSIAGLEACASGRPSDQPSALGSFPTTPLLPINEEGLSNSGLDTGQILEPGASIITRPQEVDFFLTAIIEKLKLQAGDTLTTIFQALTVRSPEVNSKNRERLVEMGQSRINTNGPLGNESSLFRYTPIDRIYSFEWYPSWSVSKFLGVQTRENGQSIGSRLGFLIEKERYRKGLLFGFRFEQEFNFSPSSAMTLVKGTEVSELIRFRCGNFGATFEHGPLQNRAQLDKYFTHEQHLPNFEYETAFHVGFYSPENLLHLVCSPKQILSLFLNTGYFKGGPEISYQLSPFVVNKSHFKTGIPFNQIVNQVQDIWGFLAFRSKLKPEKKIPGGDKNVSIDTEKNLSRDGTSLEKPESQTGVASGEENSFNPLSGNISPPSATEQIAKPNSGPTFVDQAKIVGSALAQGVTLDLLRFALVGIFGGFLYILLSVAAAKAKTNKVRQGLRIARIYVALVSGAFPFALGWFSVNGLTNSIQGKPFFERWTLFSLIEQNISSIENEKNYEKTSKLEDFANKTVLVVTIAYTAYHVFQSPNKMVCFLRISISYAVSIGSYQIFSRFISPPTMDPPRF